MNLGISLTQSSRLRLLIPVFGIIALVAMFFKLPEVSSTVCKSCVEKDPYNPIFAGACFGFLTALSLLFPSFPKREIGRAGLIGSILIFLVLTYIKWCPVCFVGHICHMMMWSIWFFTPSEKKSAQSNTEVRWVLLFLVPLSIAALFSAFNLTLMAYDFKPPLEMMGLQKGSQVPVFNAQTTQGNPINHKQNLILNFVSPDCPFCREQQKIFKEIVDEIPIPLVNVSPAPLAESPFQAIEDKDASLRKLFKVAGYPTAFVMHEGKIVRVIEGVPPHLKETLRESCRVAGNGDLNP